MSCQGEHPIVSRLSEKRFSQKYINMAYNGVFDGFDCMHRYAFVAFRLEGYAQVL